MVMDKNGGCRKQLEYRLTQRNVCGWNECIRKMDAFGGLYEGMLAVPTLLFW